MSSYALPIAPRLVKGGIVTMDPDTSIVQTVIALQYNPDSLSRSLQIQAAAARLYPDAPEAIRRPWENAPGRAAPQAARRLALR